MKKARKFHGRVNEKKEIRPTLNMASNVASILDLMKFYFKWFICANSPKHGRGERGKMGHVPYGTNTITKKVICVSQYKN